MKTSIIERRKHEKMKAKATSVLAVVMLISMLVMGSVLVTAVPDNEAKALEKALAELDVDSIEELRNLDEDTLVEIIPETEEATKELVEIQRIQRFILWTHDGEHVMWGRYGNGYFVAEDNNGEKIWGIYHKGFFAGFYGDEFFKGRYRGNRWRAEGLFGEEKSYGEFKTFPQRPYRLYAEDKPEKAIKQNLKQAKVKPVQAKAVQAKLVQARPMATLTADAYLE
jgi:hypothetical protein